MTACPCLRLPASGSDGPRLMHAMIFFRLLQLPVHKLLLHSLALLFRFHEDPTLRLVKQSNVSSLEKNVFKLKLIKEHVATARNISVRPLSTSDRELPVQDLFPEDTGNDDKKVVVFAYSTHDLSYLWGPLANSTDAGSSHLKQKWQANPTLEQVQYAG